MRWRTDNIPRGFYREHTPRLSARYGSVFICPFDLEYCARKACASRHCEKSGERPLDPCAGCGTLVVVRGVGICVDCGSAQAAQTEEA